MDYMEDECESASNNAIFNGNDIIGGKRCLNLLLTMGMWDSYTSHDDCT
jgi:hypothetical protein